MPGAAGAVVPDRRRLRCIEAELAPEGPQREDLADDIAAALADNPAAAAFFDTLAQFHRKAYLRWIEATTRRPDLRAARIAEVVDLLAERIKQRPRPRLRLHARSARDEVQRLEVAIDELRQETFGLSGPVMYPSTDMDM